MLKYSAFGVPLPPPPNLSSNKIIKRSKVLYFIIVGFSLREIKRLRWWNVIG